MGIRVTVTYEELSVTLVPDESGLYKLAAEFIAPTDIYTASFTKPFSDEVVAAHVDLTVSFDKELVDTVDSTAVIDSKVFDKATFEETATPIDAYSASFTKPAFEESFELDVVDTKSIDKVKSDSISTGDTGYVSSQDYTSEYYFLEDYTGESSQF